MLAAYTERRGGDPAPRWPSAAAADLWALVDLAARHATAPENLVAALALDLLRAIGRERDVHAAPNRPERARRERGPRVGLARRGTRILTGALEVRVGPRPSGTTLAITQHPATHGRSGEPQRTIGSETD